MEFSFLTTSWAKTSSTYPLFKTHSYTTTTGALKNAFGGLLNTQPSLHPYLDPRYHRRPARHPERDPHWSLLHHGTAPPPGSGPGPRTLIPHQKDVILASNDMVAIDAVAAKMMGFDPMSMRYINHATQRGLGQGDPREIEIVGMPEVRRRKLGLQSRRQPRHRHRNAPLALPRCVSSRNSSSTPPW